MYIIYEMLGHRNEVSSSLTLELEFLDDLNLFIYTGSAEDLLMRCRTISTAD